MKVRYIGEDRENLKQGETYEVLGVENGWFRLKTGTDEAGEDTAALAPPPVASFTFWAKCGSKGSKA